MLPIRDNHKIFGESQQATVYYCQGALAKRYRSLYREDCEAIDYTYSETAKSWRLRANLMDISGTEIASAFNMSVWTFTLGIDIGGARTKPNFQYNTAFGQLQRPAGQTGHRQYGFNEQEQSERGDGIYGTHKRVANDIVHMKARGYNTVLGRFLQPDPARDFDLYNPNSFNLYQYASNNPVNRIDPTGHSDTDAKKKKATTANSKRNPRSRFEFLQDVFGAKFSFSITVFEVEIARWIDLEGGGNTEFIFKLNPELGLESLLLSGANLEHKIFTQSGDTENTLSANGGVKGLVDGEIGLAHRTEDVTEQLQLNVDGHLKFLIWSLGGNSDDGAYGSMTGGTASGNIGGTLQLELIVPDNFNGEVQIFNRDLREYESVLQRMPNTPMKKL